MDPSVLEEALNTARRGGNVFDIPVYADRISTKARTIDAVRDELISLQAESAPVPSFGPDEVLSQYMEIFDKSLTIWDEQPTVHDVHMRFQTGEDLMIHHDRNIVETLGSKFKKWATAAPATHTRSQRNFLQDYTHLRNPLRRYLLSQAVDGMNQSIVDFAVRGSFSCFERCVHDPSKHLDEEAKRCVHFCGETLADVRKILVTDYLNLSENLDQSVLPTLPAGNEMGDKETGVINSANRVSRINQFNRAVGRDLVNWINSD